MKPRHLLSHLTFVLKSILAFKHVQMRKSKFLFSKTNMAQISSLQHPGIQTDDHRTNVEIEAEKNQNEAANCFGAGVVNLN